MQIVFQVELISVQLQKTFFFKFLINAVNDDMHFRVLLQLIRSVLHPS